LESSELVDISLIYSSDNIFVNDIAGVDIETVKKALELDPDTLMPRKTVFQYLIEVINSETNRGLLDFIRYTRNRLQLKEENKPIISGQQSDYDFSIDWSYAGYQIIPKYYSIIRIRAIYMQVKTAQNIRFFLFQKGTKAPLEYIEALLNEDELTIIPVDWELPSIDENGVLIEYFVVCFRKKQETDPDYYLENTNDLYWYEVSNSLIVNGFYNQIKPNNNNNIADYGNYSLQSQPFAMVYSTEYDYTEFFNNYAEKMHEIINYYIAIRIISNALYSKEFNQITESNRKQWENMILYWKNNLFGYQFTDKDGNIGRQLGLFDNVFNELQGSSDTLMPKQRKMTI